MLDAVLVKIRWHIMFIWEQIEDYGLRFVASVQHTKLCLFLTSEMG